MNWQPIETAPLVLAVGLFLGGLHITFRNPDNGRSTFGPDQYIGFGLMISGYMVGWLLI